jgi:spermidine synthase
MHTRLLPLYLCFFLSGSAALIYEIVWQRMLTLVFGVSTWSIAAVLSAYMAGLALGAWAFGRLADRTHHVVRAYGLVELGILLTGIAVSWSIDPLMAVYVKLAGGGEHGYYFTHLIRFALALAVFVVPSTLIGGTIPLMSRMVARHAGALGIGFGRFYAINTLGAVLGAGLAGFVLIRFIGMHASIYVAAAGNALAALIALTLGSGQPAEHPVAATSEPPDNVAGSADRDAQPVRPLYLLAGLAGLSALGYEVAWARLLAVYTLNSVYVFTMLLTVFLAALAIGSGIGARLMRARPGDTLWHVTLVQLAIGLTGPAVLVIGRFATDIGFALQGGSAGKVLLLEYGLTAAIALVPGVLLGMTLPLLVGLLPGQHSDRSAQAGRLYACNSLGSIAGTILASIALIPHFGLHATLMTLAMVNFGCGAWLATRLGERAPRRNTLVPFTAIAIFALSVFAPAGTRFLRPPAASEEATLYYREGITSIVSVSQGDCGNETLRTVYVDSQSVAGDGIALETDQKMLAHLPLLLHPAPQRAISVGYGTGGTSLSMMLHDVTTHCVEIEPAVPAAGHLFRRQNAGIPTLYAGLDKANTSFTLILDDARSWFHLAPQPYDVIVDDLTSIQYRGNGNLYTRECFELIRNQLTPDGIGCAWVPVTGIGTEPLRMVVRTFRSVFPHTSVWYMNNHVNDFVILVGTPEPLMIDIADWEMRMAERYVARDLAFVDLDDPLRLAACLLLDEQEAACYAGEGALHTDNQPYLDYLTHAGVYQDTLGENLGEMLACRRTIGGDVPVSFAGVTPDDLAQRWDTWRQAARMVVEGHILNRNGNSAGATASYAAASALIPDDPGLARLAGRLPPRH